MNTLRQKYKSFFYSFGIHLSLGLVILSAYYYKKDTHEIYTLVNLKNMKICTPCFVKEVELSEAKEVPVKPIIKKDLSTPSIKKIKGLTKVKAIKKTIPIKEIAVVKTSQILVKNEFLEKDKRLENTQEEVKVFKEQIFEVKKSALITTRKKVSLSVEAQYIQDNIALINALIKKNLYYPRLAKKRGLQGRAIVSFTLGLDAEVLNIQVIGPLSSILKKSAIKTVKKAAKDFPHPPQVLALRIPIVYKLH